MIEQTGTVGHGTHIGQMGQAILQPPSAFDKRVSWP
jgi:hypothetical protein